MGDQSITTEVIIHAVSRYGFLANYETDEQFWHEQEILCSPLSLPDTGAIYSKQWYTFVHPPGMGILDCSPRRRLPLTHVSTPDHRYARRVGR
jgi:hypothetical protein